MTDLRLEGVSAEVLLRRPADLRVESVYADVLLRRPADLRLESVYAEVLVQVSAVPPRPRRGWGIRI